MSHFNYPNVINTRAPGGTPQHDQVAKRNGRIGWDQLFFPDSERSTGYLRTARTAVERELAASDEEMEFSTGRDT